MNRKFGGEKREFTLRESILTLGAILLLYWMFKLHGDYTEQANAAGIAQMKAEVPAVKSIDGMYVLSEKMQVRSRTKGLYSGNCWIDEKADEKEIFLHYKSEFEKYGWKYIGKYYRKDVHPNTNVDALYYYFDKEGQYCIYLYFSKNESTKNNSNRIVFCIDIKKDNDDRKYCKIEDGEM